LLNNNTLMLTLRRIAWMMWLPPMERASPSPVITHTLNSGRAVAIPLAMAGARPWIECIPYVFM